MASDWEDLGEETVDYDELRKVKAQRDALGRRLEAVKHKHVDYIEAVVEATREAVGEIEIPPVPTPEIRSGPGKSEVAVALLSDLQTGKITPDYNTEVCRQRVLAYAHKIVAITEIQRKDHPVDEIVVAMLGDMVEGVDIFPGQQWLIDSTLYKQVFKSTPSIVADFLRILAANFKVVRVEAVQGNHGRIGRKGQYGPEDNADKMTYSIAELLTAGEPRITWNIADPEGERAWYQIMEIGNYKAMLIHGDQIKGSNGFPWYGLGKKVPAWASGALGKGVTFQDLYMGHYHQAAAVPLNQRTVWANGAIESYNTFAAETLAAQSEPCQWLLFVEPIRGRVTGSYIVQLREDS